MTEQDLELLRTSVRAAIFRTNYALACIALALSALKDGNDEKFRSEWKDIQKAIKDLNDVAESLK